MDGKLKTTYSIGNEEDPFHGPGLPQIQLAFLEHFLSLFFFALAGGGFLKTNGVSHGVKMGHTRHALRPTHSTATLVFAVSRFRGCCGGIIFFFGGGGALQEMQEAGVEANTVVYNSALDACGRAGKPKVAAKLLRKMEEAGERVRDLILRNDALVRCPPVGVLAPEGPTNQQQQ